MKLQSYWEPLDAMITAALQSRCLWERMHTQTVEHGRMLSRSELSTHLHFTQPQMLKPKRSQMQKAIV